MRPASPDSGAFALSTRNFDGLAPETRHRWVATFQQASRLDELPWPERAIIEIANTCNLDCPMCRVGRQGVDLRRVMRMERFKQVVDALIPHVRKIRLNGLGESTVVPGFGGYLDVLEARDAELELITNGTGEATTYRRLLGQGATLLFSWDAANESLFETLRRPARWEPVVQTLRGVSDHARERGRSDQLHLLFTLQPANVRELAAVVRQAAGWGIPNVIVNVAKLRHDWLDARSTEVLDEFGIADDESRRVGGRLFLPDRVGNASSKTRSACPTSASGCDRPWKEVVVRWDLDVQVCNMFNPYTYGNLALHSFERIWRGAFAQAFRTHINSPARHPYCRGCAYIGDVHERKHR